MHQKYPQRDFPGGPDTNMILGQGSKIPLATEYVLTMYQNSTYPAVASPGALLASRWSDLSPL